MPVLGKVAGNTKELLSHHSPERKMISSRKLLIAFLDLFITCFEVIKLAGDLHFKACSIVLESAKENFFLAKVIFFPFCVDFLFLFPL